MIYPFSVIEYEFLQPMPQPPHTEDYYYLEGSSRFIRRLNINQAQEVLKTSLYPNVEAIFEQTVQKSPAFMF
jgi:hypothetical protein